MAPEPPAPLVRLQRLAVFGRAVAAGLGEDTAIAGDLEWLADVIGAIEAGTEPARALGLRRGPGQRRPETVERTRQRDELLRQARDEHYPHLGLSAAAKVLLEVVRRCDRQTRPTKSGEPEDLILAAGNLARVPRTRQRLSTILREPTPPPASEDRASSGEPAQSASIV